MDEAVWLSVVKLVSSLCPGLRVACVIGASLARTAWQENQPRSPKPLSANMSTSTSASKKRKQSTEAPAADSRFTFSADDLAEDSPAQDEQPTASGSTQPVGAGLPAHLLPASMSGKNKPTPGLIYLSRIPPGMGPAQVKHLLGAYGEVGRVFLKRAGKHNSLYKIHSDGHSRLPWLGRLPPAPTSLRLVPG